LAHAVPTKIMEMNGPQAQVDHSQYRGQPRGNTPPKSMVQKLTRPTPDAAQETGVAWTREEQPYVQ
jgi:hypothetical protein